MFFVCFGCLGSAFSVFGCGFGFEVWGFYSLEFRFWGLGLLGLRVLSLGSSKP